ncbi:MAG: mannonate dehydratase [Actinobacteria bacterium]|nr:mannonate dehydratase [Actinomycetota bacterium]
MKYYAKQLGIKYAVVSLPKTSGYSDYIKPWHYILLHKLHQNLESFGIKLSVIEGIDFIDSAKLRLPDCDEAIDNFCQLLENMGKLGIDTVCYNWMPVLGWVRSRTNIAARGDSLVTGFVYDDVKDWPLTSYGQLTEQQLWDNLEYFLKKVVPVAERYKVKLALHPDDPPVNSIAGISRILISANAMYKATQLVQSEYNGITLCQGTFAAMCEDIPATIRRFGNKKKLFFAHFRDIKGTAENFVETFHDEGKTNMYEAMKCYYEVGYDGVIRPDHVPTMYGEDNSNPSYGILGNLYAAGYMSGIIEAIENEIKLSK